MPRSPQIERWSLFGERSAIAPEFVHLETIASRSHLHGWTISPHAHPGIFQLLLLEHGSGLLTTDGREEALGSGALVLLPSGCVHGFRFSENARGWVVSLAAALLGDRRIAPFAAALEPSGTGARLRRWAADDVAVERLGLLLADFSRELTGNRPGVLPDSLAARVALVLALAGEAFSDATESPHPTRRGTLAARFADLVELHFRDGWHVSRYAAELGATEPTLNRSCREAFGKPPNALVLDRLLLEAMRTLTYTTASASQIAADLGFADPAYFARFFKSRAGTTASAFRRERGWLAGH